MLACRRGRGRGGGPASVRPAGGAGRLSCDATRVLANSERGSRRSRDQPVSDHHFHEFRAIRWYTRTYDGGYVAEILLADIRSEHDERPSGLGAGIVET